LKIALLFGGQSEWMIHIAVKQVLRQEVLLLRRILRALEVKHAG